jgi:hypothetical protein
MTKQLLVPRLEWPAITGQSLSNCDRADACGDIASVLIGRKRFAPQAALERWVAFLTSESAAGRPVKYMARDPNERRTPERAKAERARQRKRAA